MSNENPERVSLQDLYASMEDAVDTADFDVEAGLADLQQQLGFTAVPDANGRWMCPHCRDIYGPADAEDGDVPPVCHMCKKAGRT